MKKASGDIHVPFDLDALERQAKAVVQAHILYRTAVAHEAISNRCKRLRLSLGVTRLVSSSSLFSYPYR